MKKMLMMSCTLFSLALCGQNNGNDVKEINNVEQANAFIKENPALKAEILWLNSGNDSSETAKKIYQVKAQGSIVNQGYLYKVLEINPSLLFNTNYIYLDGNKFTMPQIDSLRKLIIGKYNNRTPFADLAKEYNMDGNVTGEMGWVAEGMLVKEFSDAVKAHKKGDIFTVDVPSKKWYHVVVKNFDDRQVKIYAVLKIKSN